MTTFTVSLPDPLGDFVNEQVARGAFATPSDYIASVVQQAHAERAELKAWLDNLSPAAQKRLEALLIEGLDSGEPIEVDEDWWRQKEAALIARYRDEQSRDFGAPPHLQI
jgi:antitoxin ParD1/3/4